MWQVGDNWRQGWQVTRDKRLITDVVDSDNPVNKWQVHHQPLKSFFAPIKKKKIKQNHYSPKHLPSSDEDKSLYPGSCSQKKRGFTTD